MPKLNMRLPYFAKVCALLFGLMLVLGLLLASFFILFSEEYENEVTQTLHKSLAQKIIDDNPKLKAGEINSTSLSQAFHNMMILGPSFEFYLLNPDGSVHTYAGDPSAVKRPKVNLTPIKSFLQDEEKFPIKGLDPRSEQGNKVFSVAPVMADSELKGYLYIVVGGLIYDGVTEAFKGSHQLKIGALILGLGIVFSFMLTLILMFKIFRPLRLLSRDMRGFERDGLDASLLRLHSWKKQSKDEVEQLGYVFNQLLVRLKQQYAKIKTADEMRRELVSYVSHDLRTPLAALKGYLETWMRKQDEDPQCETTRVEMISRAQKNADQIDRLVAQLFELAHLEGTQVKLNNEVVPVAELIQDVLQKLEIRAEKKGIKLNVEPKDPSLLVKADIEKLERAITNLVDNAIRHSQQGGEILVKLDKRDSLIMVQVQDNGCGIPETDLPHIFEPHFRASNSVINKRELGGLGLAITRRIIQLHGSQIEVMSELGKGSLFRFNLEQDSYV